MINAKTRAEVLNNIIQGIDSRCTLQFTEVWKDGHIRPTYTLYSDDHNCSPTAYCDEEWFEQSDEAVAEYLIQLHKNHSFQIDVKSILTPEFIQSRVLPRLIPAKNISALQKNRIVHRPYLNLSVIYYIPINFSGESATIQVDEQLLELIRYTEEDIYGYAMKNLTTQVDFLSMNNMLQSLVGDDNGFAMPPEDDFGMWVITNRSRTFGAAALLFGTELFEALEQKFHCKIAILPSSVHECIAVPYDHENQLNDFLDMVISVNSSEVSEEDLLADCVYYHDGDKVGMVA